MNNLISFTDNIEPSNNTEITIDEWYKLWGLLDEKIIDYLWKDVCEEARKSEIAVLRILQIKVENILNSEGIFKGVT